jgi:integrase
MVKNQDHHLFKRGGTYYFQVSVNGRPIKKALCKEIGKARLLRDKLLSKIRWGHLEAKSDRLLLGDMAKKWIKVHEKKLQPSTLKDYRSIMNFHVLPYFGNWFIDTIKPIDVEEFIATLKCSSKRINNILVPLRSLFKMAKKNDFVKRNIMQDVENLPVEHPHIYPLSMDEVVLFLEKVSPHYRNFFVVAFFTGMRLGEQVALKWRSIDWDNKKILVRESRVMGIEGRPKTRGSYRDIAMLPVVEEALRDQYKKQTCKSKYVFLNTEGNPIDGETLRKTTWTPALKRAGLKYRSMYHTRHSFATLMISAGESVGWVQSMMGHASLRMIQEHYFRFIPNLTHEDGSAFSKKFGSSLEKITPIPPHLGGS